MSNDLLTEDFLETLGDDDLHILFVAQAAGLPSSSCSVASHHSQVPVLALFPLAYLRFMATATPVIKEEAEAECSLVARQDKAAPSPEAAPMPAEALPVPAHLPVGAGPVEQADAFQDNTFQDTQLASSLEDDLPNWQELFEAECAMTRKLAGLDPAKARPRCQASFSLQLQKQEI